MKVNTSTCRYCGSRAVVWTQTLAGAWRLHDARPVPYTPAVPGVVLHQSRGWLPADSVDPEPDVMLRQHVCRSAPVAPTFGELLDDWTARNRPLSPTPAPARRPRRVGRAS